MVTKTVAIMVTKAIAYCLGFECFCYLVTMIASTKNPAMENENVAIIIIFVGLASKSVSVRQIEMKFELVSTQFTLVSSNFNILS